MIESSQIKWSQAGPSDFHFDYMRGSRGGGGGGGGGPALTTLFF